MTIKVSELAKKLGRTSKEVVSKAKELGIVAKAANSSLSQADAQMIENDFVFVRIVRGLLQDGVIVKKGMKSGDVDPRAERDYCFTISDKASAVGGGVLEAVLSLLNPRVN